MRTLDQFSGSARTQRQILKRLTAYAEGITLNKNDYSAADKSGAVESAVLRLLELPWYLPSVILGVL